MNNFAIQLSQYRKKKNLTQKQLGDSIDVSDKVISKWEKGDLLPDIDNVKKLAEFFEVNLNELLIGENKNEFQVAPRKLKTSSLSIITELISFVLVIVCIVWLAVSEYAIDLYDLSGEFVAKTTLLGSYITTALEVLIQIGWIAVYFFKFKLRVPYGKPLGLLEVGRYSNDEHLLDKVSKRLCELFCFLKFIVISQLSVSVILTLTGVYRSVLYYCLLPFVMFIEIVLLYVVYVKIFNKYLRDIIPK